MEIRTTLDMMAISLLFMLFLLTISTDGKQCGRPGLCFCEEVEIVCGGLHLVTLPKFRRQIRDRVEYINANKNFLVELKMKASKWPKLSLISVQSNPLLSCSRISIPSYTELRGLNCDER